MDGHRERNRRAREVEKLMRIVIFGTGGVGGFFGGRLARAGEDVTFIARGEHLHAIKANGLRVDSTAGDFEGDSGVIQECGIEAAPKDRA